MCGVPDLDQIGCLQLGLDWKYYRHHFEAKLIAETLQSNHVD